MENRQKLALFYCKNLPESSDENRRELEKIYGSCVRFYPLPCSGRLEVLHLLRALEEFADAAFVIACPEGACRYFEGNRRAGKRVERAGSIIESIGLEKERVGIITGSPDRPKGLKGHLMEIMEHISGMSPSKVHGERAQGAGRRAQG